MKIKTLLMCMIAVFISLSGCSKKPNYAINYIGDYDLMFKPILYQFGDNGQINEYDLDVVKGMRCSIMEDTYNTVRISVFDDNDVVFSKIADCDETYIYLGDIDLEKTIVTEEYGQLNLDIELSPALASLDADGNIKWESRMEGEVAMMMNGYVVDVPVNGMVKFYGEYINLFSNK